MTKKENCGQCQAYKAASRIIERIVITEGGDKGAKIEHEKKVEMSEIPSTSDAENEKDKPCMLVQIKKFGSLVSVVMNEDYVRVSMAREDASCPGKYGPVKKVKLWEASETKI